MTKAQSTSLTQEFPRASLLDALQQVAPALAAKDIVPIYVCFCFDGEHVYAFDDSVALVARFATKFKGGVSGGLFLDWLSATSAKAVNVALDKGGQLIVKCGRAKLRLTVRPESDFILEVPTLKKALEFLMSSGVLEAFKKASLSLGTDPAHPWRMGVSVSFGKKGVVFYASDNLTVARATCKAKVVPELVGKAFILPPSFCKLLAERATKGTILLFAKSWIAARISPDLMLYSRALSDIDVPAYARLFEEVPDKKALAIPKAMQGMLLRAQTLLQRVSEASADLRIKDGKLSIMTSGKATASRDFVTLDGTHRDVEAKLLPEIVLRGLPHVDRFAVIGGQSLWLLGERFEYLVSVAGEDE